MGSTDRARLLRILTLGMTLWCCSCAETQMRYNVLSYDNAVAQGANQQLLLNAVRASQNYPMSFTAIGQVLASPPVSASVDTAFNLATSWGLDTYSITPKVAANGGYGNFALDNLNYQKFMEALRTRLSKQILKSFESNSRWPGTLLPMIYIQALHPSEAQVRAVDSDRKRICAFPRPHSREAALCAALDILIEKFSTRCTNHFRDSLERLREFRLDPKMYYNTARTYCHFARFEIFLTELRLLRWDRCGPAHCISRDLRPPLEMIGYLGELIAAQNYIEEPFEPFLLFGESTARGGYEFDIVPLFEVRRGVPAEGAAVGVVHEGELFYVPRPRFGSRGQARSLQTLDLVLQTVRAATHRDDLPKLQTFGVISSK